MARIRLASVYFFAVVFILIACRYILFVSFISIHKDSLKQQAVKLNQQSQLLISKANLYKNDRHITWKDKNKEVEINNVIYDVINIREVGCSYIVTVVSDNKETNWLSHINQLNNHKQNILNDLLNLLNGMCVFDKTGLQSMQIVFETQNLYRISKIQFLFFQPLIDLIKPPRF